MTNEQFLQQFGHFVNAPNGLQKLRELILQLAVQGKLVPQDPDDELASVLLEKIKAEKERLIKEGNIKKQKHLSAIMNDQLPWSLPITWEWCRLGDVTNYGLMNKAAPEDVRADIWILELQDVEKGTSKLLRKTKFSERPFKSSKNQFIKGDVIYGKLRPYLDKVIIADQDGVCTTEMIPIHGYYGVVSEYLRWYLKSPSFIEYANSSTHGMNLPRMSTDKARLALMPLPPLAEQSRIVAKVDELMTRCDQLEVQHKARNETHSSLIRAVHHQLTGTGDTAVTQTAWQRIRDNFTGLYATTDAVKALRQAILQLAVQGKLVPQDPNDEPAPVLLERIRRERDILIKAKKLKKGKALPAIEIGDLLFEVPSTWSWVRLRDLAPSYKNGISSRGDANGSPVIVLRLADICADQISLSNTRTIQIKDESISNYDLQKGDILIIRVNGSADIVGKFVIAEQNYDAIYCDHFIRMRINHEWLAPSFIRLVGASTLIRNSIKDLFITTAGQKTVNQGHINSLLVTLPPITEQHRIVTKVDQLMALCDQLETQINNKSTTASRYAEAIVQQIAAA